MPPVSQTGILPRGPPKSASSSSKISSTEKPPTYLFSRLVLQPLQAQQNEEKSSHKTSCQTKNDQTSITTQSLTTKATTMFRSNHHLPAHHGHSQYPNNVGGFLNNNNNNNKMTMMMIARAMFPPPRTKDSFDDDSISQESSSGSEKNQMFSDSVGVVSDDSRKKNIIFPQNGRSFPPPRTKDSFDDDPTEQEKKISVDDEPPYPSQIYHQQLHFRSQHHHHHHHRSVSASKWQQQKPSFPAPRTKTSFDEAPLSASATKVLQQQQQQQQFSRRVLPSTTHSTNKFVSVQGYPPIVNTNNSHHLLELDEDEVKLIGRGVGKKVRKLDRNHKSMMAKQHIHRMNHSQMRGGKLNSTYAQTRISKPKPLRHKDHRHYNNRRANSHPMKQPVPNSKFDSTHQAEMNWQRQWLNANGNQIQPKPDSWWMRASNIKRPMEVESKLETSASSNEISSKALVKTTPFEPSRPESEGLKITSSSNFAVTSSNRGKSGLSSDQDSRRDKFCENDRNDRKHWKKALLGKRQREMAADAANESTRHQHWTPEEDDLLSLAVAINASDNKHIDWDRVSYEAFRGIRSRRQCKQRWGLIQPGVINGDWTSTEDQVVLSMVQAEQSWSEIANRLGKKRTREAIRARYSEHLDPNLKKTPWEPGEDQMIFQLQSSLGNRWAEISQHLPGRTANAIKNRFYNQFKAISRQQKKLKVGC